MDVGGAASGPPVTIAFDALAGDNAPGETVAGALTAAREQRVHLLLVGPEAPLRIELARHQTAGLSIEVVPAENVIGMEEHAAAAVRASRNSSVTVGLRLVKDGAARGFVSAGHSGATLAAALFTLGRAGDVERPALATFFPTIDGRCVIIDAGANVDCRPQYLAQFAVMGSLYAERVLGLRKPRVGLLSNGEEETKGNQATVEAHRQIKALGLNFVGNVEGKDVTGGAADVVVTDGFAGNVGIKMAEGMGELALALLKREATRNPLRRLGALLMMPALRGVKRHVDYEEYGGAALLGVDGVAIVAHGRSRAKAIKNAIRLACQSAEADLVELIRQGVAKP